MNREIVRAEPPSTYLENRNAPIERPTELVMEQLKLCVETAGSSMDEVLKMQRALHVGHPLRNRERDLRAVLRDRAAWPAFVTVPAWPGRFDIEVDCVAAL